MNAIVKLVRKTLQEQNKVFLVTRLFPQDRWRQFCDGFMALDKAYVDTAFVFFLEEGVDCPKESCFMTVSHEDVQELCDIYLTYEFSNRFVVFSDNVQYGTVFNYVDTGILTEEEAVKAIFR